MHMPIHKSGKLSVRPRPSTRSPAAAGAALTPPRSHVVPDQSVARRVRACVGANTRPFCSKSMEKTSVLFSFVLYCIMDALAMQNKTAAEWPFFPRHYI